MYSLHCCYHRYILSVLNLFYSFIFSYVSVFFSLLLCFSLTIICISSLKSFLILDLVLHLDFCNSLQSIIYRYNVVFYIHLYSLEHIMVRFTLWLCIHSHISNGYSVACFSIKFPALSFLKFSPCFPTTAYFSSYLL